MDAYIHTYIHACMHACMHTCMHTYIHTTHNFVATIDNRAADHPATTLRLPSRRWSPVKSWTAMRRPGVYFPVGTVY